jgi:hypothetical protein
VSPLRVGIGLALLAVGLASGACTPRCRSTDDCERGEFCDFDQRACVVACTSDEDCSPTARCDLDRGQCRLRMTFPPPAIRDSGVLDAGTSTTSADAG